MLAKADQAIVVVCEETKRSESMEGKLQKLIDDGGLVARQVLLPVTVLPRLDTERLPLVKLTDAKFIDSIMSSHRVRILHATDKHAAKLLMAPMRDTSLAGPALREAHRRTDFYLATEFLSDILGLEEYMIPHVQGGNVAGHRFLYEKQTAIVALMRGGEPMALGVNDALPAAIFVHAGDPTDVKLHHLHRTVLLVDSVVNNGNTVVDLVQHIRSLHDTVRIVVVAGVVQSKSLGRFSRLFGKSDFGIVTLRLSDNKSIGTGTTDTGNRLFNTTHLL
jgi:uracil phosphoribosyltransferase